MKLLFWNIRQGGGSRREKIASSIAEHKPDIVGLIEFIPRVSALEVDWLDSTAFLYQSCTKRNGQNYAVCIISKQDIVPCPCDVSTLQDSGLWLEVAVPTCSFSFGLAHVPTNGTAKQYYCDALVQIAKSRAEKDFLFAGDFNTGVHLADGDLKSLGCVAQFAAIREAGFSDAWRHFHSNRQEFSFERGNKQYRIDHALASATLTRRLTHCRYSHDERRAGVSDHSPLIVELDGTTI